MKNSLQFLKTLLIEEEKLSTEQLNKIKGGECGSPNDPRRCKKSNNQKQTYYQNFKKVQLVSF